MISFDVITGDNDSDGEDEKKVVADKNMDEEGYDIDEDIAALMGFNGFDSTKVMLYLMILLRGVVMLTYWTCRANLLMTIF